jgi:hypothetical protein
VASVLQGKGRSQNFGGQPDGKSKENQTIQQRPGLTEDKKRTTATKPFLKRGSRF